jgi:hypothetical protein
MCDVIEKLMKKPPAVGLKRGLQAIVKGERAIKVIGSNKKVGNLGLFSIRTLG